METALLAPTLWILLSAAALISAIFGTMFAYHWVRFSTSPATTFVSITTYAVGILILLFIMAAATTTL